MNQYDRYLLAMVTLATADREPSTEAAFNRDLERAWFEVGLWQKLPPLRQEVLRLRSSAESPAKGRRFEL